jgi:hypothetical protein
MDQLLVQEYTKDNSRGQVRGSNFTGMGLSEKTGPFFIPLQHKPIPG